MPGFVHVDRHTFYADIWPRIKKDVEAMESNWADAKKGVRPIVIKWGYKDENTGETIILAVILYSTAKLSARLSRNVEAVQKGPG